jgi:hypothetical protein
MEEDDHTPASVGTPRPILLDDDIEAQMDMHYWHNQSHGPYG